MEIPETLVDEYKKEQVLVFIGQGINGDEWSQLGLKISKGLALDINEKFSLPELAQIYEDKNDRHSLISLVKNFYSDQGRSHQGHNLLALVQRSNLFVTTCIDDHVEKAFEAAGRPLDVIIDQTDRAYQRAGFARLYKLHGCLSRPDSLKITTQDIQTAYFHEHSLPITLKGHLADHTILFVGVALDDPLFEQFYLSSIYPLDRHARSSYALGGHYSISVELFCKRNQIALITYDPADFLSSLLEADNAAEASLPKKQVLLGRLPEVKKRPFKKFSSYTNEDQGIFFGRQAETEHVISLIQANRWVVVHGQSGVGKSSLLAAGVVPQLSRLGYAPVLVNVDHSIALIENIKNHILELITQKLADNPLPAEQSLAQLLQRLAQNAGKLVIFIDQFEDHFIHHDALAQQNFLDVFGDVVEAIKRLNLPVKWVFSIQSEHLWHMNKLSGLIPNIFEAEFQVDTIDQFRLKEAINFSLDQVGMKADQNLVDRILNDLGPERVELPQLQLVCDQLYDAAQNHHSQVLSFEDYSSIGETTGVLNNYLQSFLQRFLPVQGAQIQTLLQALVTSSNELAQLTVAELAETTRIVEAEITTYIQILQDERLVIIRPRSGQAPAYQLAHLVLARTLSESPEALARKAAWEMVKQETARAEKFSTLFSPEQLDLLHNYLDVSRLAQAERRLVFRSVLRNGEHLDEWTDKLYMDELCREIIYEQFGSGQSKSPLAALQVIGYLPDPAAHQSIVIQTALSPDQPRDVRRRAALLLATKIPDAISILVQQNTILARQALTFIFQAQDNGEIQISLRRRFDDQLRLVTARLLEQKEYILWSALVAGMLAGGLGGALGGAIVWPFTKEDAFWFVVLISLFSSGFMGFFVLGAVRVMEVARQSQRWLDHALGGFIGGATAGILINFSDANLQNIMVQLPLALTLGIVSGVCVASAISLAKAVPLKLRPLFLLLGGAFVGGAIGWLAGISNIQNIGIDGGEPWHIAVMLAPGFASVLWISGFIQPQTRHGKAQKDSGFS